MTIIEANELAKGFWMPSVQRDTVREHLLGALEPRSFRRMEVLHSVSFQVARGESVALVGRNGCGKSTLLKLLCGIYVADAGSVDVRGAITPILELGVGWHPELDALDNILLLGTVMGMKLREVEEATEEILAFAELERFARLSLKHFSSGMMARLAYAVAFRAVREVLVLDEVYAVGDVRFRARCEQRHEELRRAGHTILLVSHDPEVIAQCDRALLLEGGRIEADAAPDEILRRHQQNAAHA